MDPGAPFLAKNDERTFQHDDTLPPLPVPPLKQTLEKYLDSVKPHVSEEEYNETARIVDNFSQGIGKSLHEKLLARAKNERNWLEKWWEDHAYLEGRNPIAPFVNCGGPGPYIDNVFQPKTGTQLSRGALVLYYQLRYWQLLRQEKLRPDRGSDNSIWAMNTFSRLFNCCRIPGEKIDSLLEHFKTEREGDSPRYVVIIHRGHMFYTDVIDEHNQPYTPPEIEEQLQHVIDRARQLPVGPGLGCLTADQRTAWFKNRQHLISLNPDNEKNLDIIQKSLFIVALDDGKPVDRSQVMAQSLGGDPACRWFDKSLNIILFRNGTVGENIDHCPFDAMVLVSCCYYVDLHIREWDGKWEGSLAKRSLPQPQQLVFHLDSKLHQAITNARTVFIKNTDSMDYYAPMFTGYGKNFLKSMKLHPDTAVQLALQLGYYRMHNKPAATYETATTRRFYHARTETVRSCTTEAIDWCKSMLDTSTTTPRKYQLFQAAYKKHLKLMAEASNAQGCDRHLFGLYILAQKEGLPVPEIFTDPSFAKSGGDGNFLLMTSYVGHMHATGGASPMCTRGYGCFYLIGPSVIWFFVSSWKPDNSTSSRLLFDNICKSFEDIQTLLNESAPGTKWMPNNLPSKM